MKVKFLAYATALLATAVLGVSQLQANATLPGQVGDAPRCTVDGDGERAGAFDIKNNVATVGFKVSGPANCKVQLSVNMFYAPTMDGRPYSKQILYQRNTKIFVPGHYTMSADVPTKSTKAKGCFYQVDLTYGTRNVTPVLAFGHGKLDCGEEPDPVATCDSLKATPVTRTKFNFVTNATAKNGAKIKSYTYTVRKNGKVVDTKSINSTQESNSYAYTQSNPGNYTVKVVVETSEGPRSGDKCVATFTVKEASNPGVTITKTVNGKEHEIVELNQPFTYQLKVTNTGNVALKNVTVSDKAPAGVQFVSAQPGSIAGNTWSYTIPSLAVNQSILVAIQAKVVKAMPKTIVNTACVDATETPASPDACDTATVDTPKPNMVEVCDPETGTIIMVDEKDKDNYLPKDSDECSNITVCVLETGAIITIKKSEMDESKYAVGECPVSPKSEPLPEALPTTGPVDAALQVVGAASLAGASGYYWMSRRRD